MRAHHLIALGLLGLSACGGCDSAKKQSGSDACILVEHDDGPPGEVKFRVETVASGLEVPWSLAFLPDGDLLVTERPGRLRLIHQGQLVPEPVAKVEIASTSEGGLLGLALAPDFAKSRRFFLYVTAEEDGRAINRVEAWTLAPDARSAKREKIIVDGIEAARFHDGGRLRVGPDGKLYVSVGDARHPERAQDKGSRNGKLLRLELDGSVPKDNPVPGNPLYLLGVRNSEGYDWRPDGTMLVADHGPSGELGRRGHDEVNVAHAGDNLGWPTIYSCETHPGMVTPSITWDQALPPGGAALYRGSKIPEWRGSLLLGVLGAKQLHRVVFADDGRRVARHEVYLHGDPPSGYGRLRDVVNGPDGALYVTTSNCDGRGNCPKDKDRILRLTR